MTIEDLTTKQITQIGCFIKHGDQKCKDCNAGMQLATQIISNKQKSA